MSDKTQETYFLKNITFSLLVWKNAYLCGRKYVYNHKKSTLTMIIPRDKYLQQLVAAISNANASDFVYVGGSSYVVADFLAEK